jgi:purine-binding chemotaxis protein CheW
MPAKTFVSFKLNGQLFGIDIRVVREINRHLDLTLVPLAPELVRGVVNLRGQIVTVLDLKTQLGLAQSVISEISHNIILKTDSDYAHIANAGIEEGENLSLQDRTSFLVDEIGDVVTVDNGDIEPPPANIGDIDGRFLSGVIKLDNTLMGIISVARVFIENTERIAA